MRPDWITRMFTGTAPTGEYPKEPTRICESCDVKWSAGALCWMCGKQGVFLASRGIKPANPEQG